MGKGVCGILRPNGVFIGCDYGKHHTIVEYIPEDEEDKVIFFSSDGIKGSVYTQSWLNIINKPLTIEQVNWIKKHINEFTVEQLVIVKGWIEITEKSLKEY